MCRDLGELLAEGLQTEAGLGVQKLDRDPSTRQQANCPGVLMVGGGWPAPCKARPKDSHRTGQGQKVKLFASLC